MPSLTHVPDDLCRARARMTFRRWRQMVLAFLAWSVAFWYALCDGPYAWRVMFLAWACFWGGLLALMGLALLCDHGLALLYDRWMQRRVSHGRP